MIKISKIPDAKAWTEDIAKQISKGMRTNFYASAEDFLPMVEAGQLSCMPFAGGVYYLLEKEKQFDLYFFLEQEAKPVPLPQLSKPVILEQVALEKKGISPTAEEWEAIGFSFYLQRKRLFLSAKKAEAELREVCFCKEEDADVILEAMYTAFEPYTSALPTKETLLEDLRQENVIAARENGELLGFLRFGREKKVSVLWQIVVNPVGRGKGIGEKLVRDWIALEKDEVSKFQLWVREDNAPALRLYEKSVFLPDGRIAPVMIKQ